MVVAHQSEHAAVLGRSGNVGVAEDVARAVDARTFAVPECEHPVMLAFAQQSGLLGAPAGGRGELFVEPRLELDMGGFEGLLRLPELLVETAER